MTTQFQRLPGLVLLAALNVCAYGPSAEANPFTPSEEQGVEELQPESPVPEDSPASETPEALALPTTPNPDGQPQDSAPPPEALEAPAPASHEGAVSAWEPPPPQLICPDPSTLECVRGRTEGPTGITPLTYTASDKDGHALSCTTTLTVQDTQPPALTLLGPDVIVLGHGVSSYTEPGFFALDACAGDLSAQVEVIGAIDPTVPGLYPLIYSVTDGAGLTTTATRLVEVVAPEVGPCRVPLTVGTGTTEIHLLTE
jgi:hypothetical protein